MAIIQANKGIITQINTFTVPAGGQQALTQLRRFDCTVEVFLGASD
jgi:hypothetical protein